MTLGESAIQRLTARRAVVGVLGLGYAGLPLALAFAEAGFRSVGFDIDQQKVDLLQHGRSYIRHISSKRLSKLISSNAFSPTADADDLDACDVTIICVPTPFDDKGQPNLNYVGDAANQIRNRLHAGELVVLASTTCPGTTEEVLLPVLAGSGLEVGKDFFLAFSPEREDPGNREYTTRTTPRLVGGITSECLAVATAAFETIVDQVVPVSSARIAEAAKLLENIYRCVNVAMINELKVLFEQIDIDVWEVIKAASSKPFGFAPFYPGPGLGGPCIPLAPFYLSWTARQEGLSQLIRLAGEINSAMPLHVVNTLGEALSRSGKRLGDANILLLGVAYKANVDDVRESPALAVLELLEASHARVDYHDPLVPRLSLHHRPAEMSSIELSDEAVRSADAVVIITAHSAIDYQLVLRNANLVIDTRNATAPYRKACDRVLLA